MTLEEYKAGVKSLQEEFEQKKNQLAKSYALSQAIFKVGDIIKDNRWYMQITALKWSYGYSEPEIVYEGVELKKDLTPKKNNNKVTVYGNKGVELVKSAQ